MTTRRIRYLAPLIVLAVAAIAAAFLISSGGESTKTPPAPSLPLVQAPGLTPARPLLTATAGASYPLQLRREDGRQIVIAAQPRRILSLSAGATEILFAIGAGPQVAGVSPDSDYPPAAAALPHIAADAGVAATQAVNPDLIVIVGAPQQTVRMLDSTAVPVMALRAPATVAELEQQIQFFGDISGRLTDAQRAAAALGRRVDALQRQLAGTAQGPSVFVQVAADGRAAGPAGLTGDMLHLLKAQNIVTTGTEPYPVESADTVASANPDVIVLPSAGGAAAIATPGAWANVAAVRNGRVATIDPVLVTRPGPRVADGLLMLEQILYPNRP
ncbi:MAG TPA: ABC transporter substrate-binding protein [Dehalococcoidia bacterium]|nr:ABC transporter substrate-binding protein [Dehalococcoidia bacterium]